MTDKRECALAVEHLTVRVAGGPPIIHDVSVRLASGEILGVVGESGSGKTTLALAALGFARPGAEIAAGEITVAGRSLLGQPERELRRMRGRLVAYVPQDPASSLNPARRIRDQLTDRVARRPTRERDSLIRAALSRAQLPSSDTFLSRFPHQLSGGQQQRALIAMAIVDEPELIVLDEPTTGLDVVTQAGLLDELVELKETLKLSLVYVSHDIAAVAAIADRIAVMYAGRIVEHGALRQLLSRPLHPYTVGLVESIPDPGRPTRLEGLPGIAVGVGQWPVGCAFAPRCTQAQLDCSTELPTLEEAYSGHSVRCIHWHATPHVRRLDGTEERSPSGAAPVLAVEHLRAVHRHNHEEVTAADDISFVVHPGECVGLVGESGSGKTTVARCIAGLHKPSLGVIRLEGRSLAPHARDRSRDDRRRLQFIFQNPYESLNPRHRVGSIVSHAAMVLRGLGRHDAASEAARVIDEVRLPRRILDRYPAELSGGERQRVAIARALVAAPDVLICDEITSALDVSVQAAVLDLLRRLQETRRLAMLFITHDLGVVASVADQMLVLNQGQISEGGRVRQLLTDSSDAYTRTLLEAAPRLKRDVNHLEV